MIKLRICCLINHFDPDTGGGGAVYTDLVYELAKQGAQITLVCPVAFYPEFRDKQGRNGLRVYHERRGNLSLHRYGFFIPTRPRSLLQRLVFEVSLTLSMLRALPLMRDHDALVVFVPYFAQLVVGTIARLSFRIPAWLNVQDIMSDAAEATGRRGHRLIFTFMRALESWLLSRFDVLSTISPKMAERLEAGGRSGQPVLVIPNWPDRRFMEAIEKHRKSARRLDRRLRLLYAGNIGAKQNLCVFCKFLAQKDLDVAFEVYGDGGAAEEVEEFIESLEDDRFRFGSFLPIEDFAARLREADLYVITERSGVGGSFFPSKLMSAYAAGAPVLAISDRASPLGTEMSEAQPGPHFTWEELDKVAELLKGLGPADPRLVEWSQRSSERAAMYDRDAVIGRIVELLTCLARRQTP